MENICMLYLKDREKDKGALYYRSIWHGIKVLN